MTIRIPLKADQETAAAFRQIQRQIDELKNGPLDLQGRRIVNGSNGQNGSDFVTLQQIKALLKAAGITV